jgi:hypothetical protein
LLLMSTWLCNASIGAVSGTLSERGQKAGYGQLCPCLRPLDAPLGPGIV